MGKWLTMLVLMTGCAVEAPDDVIANECDADPASCQEYAVTWATVGMSDSPGVPDPVVCTDEASHPCPFLLYTHTLLLGEASVTWTDASGALDASGVPVENRKPWIDETTIDDEGITLPLRGDDAGLRREARLVKTSTGYEGYVSWTLFNVAGTTSFHVEIAH